MATDTEVKEQQKGGQEKEKSEKVEARYALLFELESVAVNGRQAAFEVLRSILSDHNVDFTEVHYSRYCLAPAPELYLATLLEALGCKKLNAQKLVDEVNNGIRVQLSSSEAVLNPLVDALLRIAEERGVQTGALTCLPGNAGRTIAGKLGLSKRGVALYPQAAEADPSFPRADTWLKVAKEMGKSPRQCVVLASTMESCKTALSAGMQCVALPDRFTAFQDFGGAQRVLESEEALDPGELAEVLFPVEA